MSQDFVSLLLNYTKDYESPTAFWKWSGYATIGALLRNNLYYQHGLGRIYPNVYVVLLADSAEYRKGQPINLCGSLIQHQRHTKVLSGSTSKEAILEFLSQEQAIHKTGITLKGGQAILLAEELAAFFVQDPKLVEELTNLHDYKEVYDRNLRSGKFTIKELCLSMLACSNEEFLREVYDRRAVYGGLLGRTFMVKPDETRKGNSLMYFDMNDYNIQTLHASLEKITELKGAVVIKEEARKLYNDWYLDLYGKYKSIGDKSGVVQRMHTNVLKLAIILAANEYSLEISIKNFEDAILLSTSLMNNYELYSMNSGAASTAKVGTLVLNAMWEGKDHAIRRNDLLMKHWNELTLEDLEEVINKLMQAQMIIVTPNGTSPTYKMTDKCIAKFEKRKM